MFSGNLIILITSLSGVAATTLAGALLSRLLALQQSTFNTSHLDSTGLAVGSSGHLKLNFLVI
jgi:hypothetical protein